MDMMTTNGDLLRNGTTSMPVVPKVARREALRTSIEGLGTRAWKPLESLALRAQSLLPFFPRAALTLSDDGLEVVLELPGVDAADLQVSLHDGTLEVRGTKRAEREIRTRNCDRTERYHTPFGRSIRVRAPIDTETVGATLKNGLLRVRLPKAKVARAGSQSMQIQIKAG